MTRFMSKTELTATQKRALEIAARDHEGRVYSVGNETRGISHNTVKVLVARGLLSGFGETIEEHRGRTGFSAYGKTRYQYVC